MLYLLSALLYELFEVDTDYYGFREIAEPSNVIVTLAKADVPILIDQYSNTLYVIMDGVQVEMSEYPDKGSKNNDIALLTDWTGAVPLETIPAEETPPEEPLPAGTAVFASLYFNNFSATEFASANTPVKALGETTGRALEGWNHVYNQLTYMVANPIQCEVTAQAYITGTEGDQITLYIAKDGDPDESSACQLVLPADGIMFSTNGIYDADIGTYFEIWVENNTGTDSVTVKDKASFLSIKNI